MPGVVGVNDFTELSTNFSHQQPHACLNTPKKITRWEYFLGVFDYISFFS